MKFEVTLKIDVGAQTGAKARAIEQLGSAGLSGVLVGTGQPRILGVRLMCENTSEVAAILAAMTQVKSAIPHALFVEHGSALRAW